MAPSPSEYDIEVRQSSNRHTCPKCYRPFDRSDSLLRHMRVHDEHRMLRRRKRIACVPCSKSKIKCTGEQPSCPSCVRRQINCVYGSNRARPEALHNEITNNHSPPNSNQPRRYSRQNPDQQVSHVRSLQTTNGSDFGFPNPIGTINESPTNASELSSTTPTARLCSILDSGFTNLLGATDMNANIDWLFDSVPGDDALAFGNLNLFNDVLDGAESLSDRTQQDITNYEVTNTLPCKDSATPDLPTISHSEDSCNPDDPWPMEWHAESLQHPLELPVLGAKKGYDAQIFDFFSSWSLKSTTVEQFAQYLKIPAQRSPWQPANLKHFPSKELFEHCIDRYFAQFQKVHPLILLLVDVLRDEQVWPLIHRPTFDPDKDPTVTLAIVSIGALYTHLSEAKSFSNTLSELNRRLLLFMAEYDRRYVRAESYLTTQLLQGLHGYCSGNKRLFELSESSRNNLVHQAKCIGLFHCRPHVTPGTLSDMPLEERWKDWVQQEQRIRLGWAIFNYDASVSYLHNSRPFLNIGDMALDLPCALQYWNAESAHCWLSMLHSPALNPKSLNLRATLQRCLDHTSEPGEKLENEEHRFMVILTLARMVWTLKDMRAAPINEFVHVGPESLAPPVLEALDLFVQAPQRLNATLTTEEMARAMNSQQVIHIAHLYGAGPLMNWLFPLLRHGDKATVAQRQLNLWAAQKPEAARKAAYHSAQILALARTYPSNSPNEPFLIFHAGTILFYLAKLLVEQEPSDRSVIVRLDHLDAGNSDTETSKLKAYIRTGQAHKIILQGMESLCCEIGRRHILEQTIELLRRRTVWGIADSFVKVVLSLRESSQRPCP